ncbi:MAG TPA: cell division protein ZapA [Firmicutes bacterium]|nr:cell division protein ZapA [Bacillota bacterium]
MAKQSPSGDQVQSVRVRIAGDEYNIRGIGGPEYIKELAQIVDSYLAPVVQRYPNLSRNRASILAMMNMAHDLQVQKRENRELMELVSEIEK